MGSKDLNIIRHKRLLKFKIKPASDGLQPVFDRIRWSKIVQSIRTHVNRFLSTLDRAH